MNFTVTLTIDGEMLLGYARRLLAINREAVSKFIVPDIVGVVRLGSPDDYGERVLPSVLKRFAQSHPAVAVDVTIDLSGKLRRRLGDRELDITLMTSCRNVPPDAEILLTEPVVWGGARGGSAHLREPLPVSLWEEGCVWRADALEALTNAGRSYRVAYMSAHTAGQRAAIGAGLEREGARLLGGDAEAELTYRFATAEERAWMERVAERVSEIAHDNDVPLVVDNTDASHDHS